MKQRLKFGLCVLWLTLSGAVSLTFAQTPTPTTAPTVEAAAPMTVTFPGVELRRVNTDLWLPLPRDAVAPLGVGDTIRTNEQGRVWIDVLGAYEVLLLPNSALTVLSLGHAADNKADVVWAARLDGHIVQRTLQTGNYQLDFAGGRIVQPAELMAVWSDFEQTPFLSVFNGTAQVQYQDDGDVWRVDAGEAFYLEDDAPVVITPEPPLNAAHIIGQVWGCAGQVVVHRTVERLNVRVGPGLGYSIIGYIEDNSPAQVMGVNAIGTWYRVQRLSGFGWVEGLAVVAECDEALPVFPRLFLEQNAEIFEPSPEEIALLSPFYGEPKANLWFYRNVGQIVP